jgi:hypothetical protein
MPQPEPRYVIWSFEHAGWWRPGAWGYTVDLAAAGHYTRAEAEGIVARANIVATNEACLPLAEALVSGPPAVPPDA